MTDIVFIGAVGRSGTTLLERTLATAPTTIAVGEVVHLWERGVRSNEVCGCGSAFSSCPFWKAVGERAFGGWEKLSMSSVDDDRRRVDRNRYIPFLIAPRFAPRSFRDAHRRYVDVLDRLYTAIAEVAIQDGPDTDVIVDSSKHPSYLFLIRALPHHRVHLLHVVRDPRGVANSWSREVARPEDGEPMEQLGTFKAVARWTSHNLLFQLGGWLRVPRRRLAYEHFARDPRVLGRRVDDLVGRRAPAPIAVDGAEVTLGVDHTVSGNPVRFRSGTITVRSDDSWRSEMPSGARRLVGALSTPLRQVYAR
jgi:hypothetical protein